jgi:DNA topoisomerase III
MTIESIVLVAEKPSVAKSIADWLARTKKLRVVPVGRTHLEVGHYKISWLFGHVLENLDPHEYNPDFKYWKASHLPIVPPVWQLKPREEVDRTTRRKTGRPDPGTLAQIKALKDLLKSATEVIGAGDADQEGQLLQDEFLLWAGNRAPVKRLWLTAVDDASIARAWAAMKPNSDYAGYYWAALARSHADWLAGINLSRACTKASEANGGNAVLSVGRVQTPTTALVVMQERLIRAFKPVEYFTPFVQLGTTPEFKASWSPNKDKDPRLDSEGRLQTRKVAEAIAAACKAAGIAVVTLVDSTKVKEHAPLPFSLSTLQGLMDKRYGMGVQDTLKYAQSLYEKKVATYPRTDCEFLPESLHLDVPDTLTVMLGGVKGLGGAPAKADPTFKSRAFDDKKVSAHHAIIPRPATSAQLAALSDKELLVWIEIAKRYLLQFFPSAEYLSSEIELDCAGEPFRATGKMYTIRGWKDAFAALGEPDEEEAGAVLPKVAVGDKIKVKLAGLDATKTKKPKRFTEGTLLTAMKSVHKYVSDPKLKTILRDNVGIGTEATRANTIGELLGRGYIILDKREIKPTKLGEDLIDTLPTQISAPDMTALWQQAMDDIMKSEQKGYEAFIAAQVKWLSELVREVPSWFSGKSMTAVGKAAKGAGLKTKPTTHTCLKCKGSLAHIEGKFGWFFGCQTEACKAVFKDVGGLPVEKAAAPTGALTVGTLSTGDKCPKCGKGVMQTRVCGPTSKSPGKQFLSCSQFFATGKAKCDHSVWPK